MRVLYVSKALVVSAYRDKIRELRRHVDVDLVVPERWGAEAVEPSPPGVPEPRRVPVLLHGRNHVHVYPTAARWLAEHRPDLVHIDEEPYSLVTWQLARLCRRLGVPSLFFAAQNLVRPLPPPFGTLRRQVFERVTGGLAGTEAAAKVLRDVGYTGTLGVIAQLGVDPERFRPDPEAGLCRRARLGVPADALVVGYAGRIVPEKGLPVLVESVARLAGGDDAPPVVLLIVGSGPEEAPVRALVERRGLGAHVRFHDPVPSTEVPALLASFDVLVLPSISTPNRNEQFGRILVEAMAVGVPVIGSRVGEIPKVVGDAGVVVPPEDPGALADALAGLLSSEGCRAELARRGRERALRHFTNARIAERTVSFYRRLLARERAA